MISGSPLDNLITVLGDQQPEMSLVDVGGRIGSERRLSFFRSNCLDVELVTAYDDSPSERIDPDYVAILERSEGLVCIAGVGRRTQSLDELDDFTRLLYGRAVGAGAYRSVDYEDSLTRRTAAALKLPDDLRL